MLPRVFDAVLDTKRDENHKKTIHCLGTMEIYGSLRFSILRKSPGIERKTKKDREQRANMEPGAGVSHESLLWSG